MIIPRCCVPGRLFPTPRKDVRAEAAPEVVPFSNLTVFASAGSRRSHGQRNTSDAGILSGRRLAVLVLDQLLAAHLTPTASFALFCAGETVFSSLAAHR
jgi:hypothetical protein